MSALVPRRVALVWLALVAATCVSWALGASHGAEGDGVRAATAAALAIAFVKVRFVGLDFMELRGAPPLLRGLFEAWVLLVGGTVVVLHLVA